MQKGMSDTLAVVVAAIVILITALVIITIFSGAIGPVGGFAEARNNCELQARTTCTSTGGLPETWNIRTQRVEQTSYACSSLQSCSCDPITRAADCTPIL